MCVSPVVASTVDGARAFGATVTYQDGVSSRITLVFRGTTQLSVQCQYRTAATLIQTGCTQVLGSVQITS